ncbi:MAG: hypothetical protein QOE77_732 [Blastocatellia bacterium]|jgi:hypothetical protein|nr:hypothetical protein [Blastocatellia bacterium]
MTLSSDLLKQFARRQSIGSNEPGATPLIAFANEDEFVSAAVLSDSAELNDILERAINFALPNANSTPEVSFLSLSASLESILTFHRRQDEYKILPPEDFTELERDLKKWLKQHRVLAHEPGKRALVYEKFRELNRFPMSHIFKIFCEYYSLDLTDLWPVIGKHAEWPLTEIRHRLVHGDPFPSRPAEAMECAEKHLRWVVERMLLSVLGWPIGRSSVSFEYLANGSLVHGWRNERARFA